jgi:broad specificity phosphatase PhoE
MSGSEVAVVLARHGETDANLPPFRFQGRTDEPLNDRGREQARALAVEMAATGLRAIWSSDLSRAVETAKPVAELAGLEVRVDARLSESHRGEWEGRLMDDVAAEEPELFAAWRTPDPDFRFPGGESLTEHRDRAERVLADILEGPLPALAVCHGGTIRCLLATDLTAFHRPVVPNCAGFPFGRDGRPLPP